jgi:hypothetical protein
MSKEPKSPIKMKEKECELIAACRDGGTLMFKDSEGIVYYVDGRIGTHTKDKVFDRYPSEPNAVILDIKIIRI